MVAAGESDETLIKKRLLYGTTTTRGEPPFKKLAQRFVNFSKHLEAGRQGPAADEAESLLQELSGIEFMGQKMVAVQQTNIREQKRYQQKQAELEENKIQARKDIEIKKDELKQARLKREQNEEYERLKDACMKLDRRSDTGSAINRLQESIQGIESSTRELVQSEELQKKRFAVLAHYMSQLEGEMEEEAGGSIEDSPAPLAEHSQS